MRRNHDLDAALAELDAVGIRAYDIAQGGKHLQLRWCVRGQVRMLTVSSTPSDQRSPRNTRSEIRKLLRFDGLLPESNGRTPTPLKASPCWREQIETISRQLHRVCVPSEKLAERAAITAALRRLMNTDGPTHEGGAVSNGKEVVTG